MAISTYSELQTAVANLINRSDMTTRIPEWIASAERRIFYGSREGPYQSDPLRIRAMEQSSYATISAQATQLPTSFLQAKRFYIAGDSGGKLELVSPDYFWDKYVVTTSGCPIEYCIEGENLLVGPTPDSSYTGQMLYYKKFAALSGASDTNWLLTNAPYAYVHGAAIEAFRYVNDQVKMMSSHGAFCGIINALQAEDSRDRFSGPWRSKVA